MNIPILIGLCLALTPGTPTAEEVLAKTRKALGGGKLAALKSLTATGHYRRVPGPGMRIQTIGGLGEGPTVITGEREVSWALPDSYLKADTINNGMVTLLEGWSEGKGWNDSRSSMGGMVMFRTVGPGGENAADRVIGDAFRRYLMVWTLNAPGVEFTYAGEAEASDGKADVLEAKGPDGFAMRVFLDKESHLPLMMTYQSKVAAGGGGQMRIEAKPGERPDPEKIKEQLAKMPPPPMKDVEIQIRVSEYEKVSGVQLPKVITWTMDGKLSEEFEVAKYVLNPPLTPDKFKKGK